MSVEENMRLMQTLDDAWNSQDWATFEKHHAKDVDVFWPGQDKPTHSRPSHTEEAIAFFKIFPGQQGREPAVQNILRPGGLSFIYSGDMSPVTTGSWILHFHRLSSEGDLK